MKTQINRWLICLMIACGFASCGNKIDNGLSRQEETLDSYEAKEESGSLTAKDIQQLQFEMMSAGRDIKGIITDEEQLTPAQKHRLDKIQDRCEDLFLNGSLYRMNHLRVR